MSGDKGTRSFTIRLTPDDQRALAELCALCGLDRPNAIRRAVRQALASRKLFDGPGCFVPLGSPRRLGFRIQVGRKVAHG